MANMSWKARRRILVVDDDPESRRLVCNLLSQLQCDPLEAASGQEALKLLWQGGIDMALLDLVMPSMDGLATMSALMTPELGRLVQQKGAQGWLDKPVQRRALSTALLSIAFPSGFADS